MRPGGRIGSGPAQVKFVLAAMAPRFWVVLVGHILEHLKSIVGPKHVLTDAADTAPYVSDWLGHYTGSALAVVRPGSTAETAAVVRACTGQGVPVVPQGGNTSLSGGATPDGSGRAVVLSLSRMNRVLNVDPVGNTIALEAGCVLVDAQAAAREAGRLFPVTFGAEGTSTVGGAVATNAGGMAVVKYGGMHHLTLGVEVVLADGRVWNGMRALYKDSSGYSMRDMFIGSEGTLGVITGAVLRLLPLPTARVSAFVAVADGSKALEVLALVKARCGDRLAAFEFMTGACLHLVLQHVPGARLPFAAVPEAALLIELSDTTDEDGLRGLIEQVLVEASEAGIIEDATVAQSVAQTSAFWHIRSSISEALVAAGRTIKLDLSIPIHATASFVAAAHDIVADIAAEARPIVFGHLSDGNLHYNILGPVAAGDATFASAVPRLTQALHDEVIRIGGSICAEHGIGQTRVSELTRTKTPLELEMMTSLKGLFDPAGLLNPGKLLPLRAREA